MQSLITMNQSTRRVMATAVQDLSAEQWFTIPDGFDNNIAWNIGHVVAVQQSVMYRLSGLDGHISKAFSKMFNPGTSPADWTEQPDPAELLAVLESTIDALQTDYDNGIFVKYRGITTASGLAMNNIEEAAAFNLFHEGLHLGMILALKNLV